MYESVSRLEHLRSVRAWLLWQLRRTDDTIAELERQEVMATRAARTLPPPPRGWKLAMRRAGDGKATPDAVHTGDCGMAGKNTKPLAREQALRALTEDGVTACPYCRPDTDLGVL
ncbi:MULTISPECIES: DUF6233 domain-containing protein [unclassified Streptomyces]|uniref:DUF6233 domain-containing protein n=1 Tax=unclassified Streptomyces TaxID=2593676 RepID=UPI002251C947|nr:MULTISPECIES: DUF6233 domain-containing protein [unclassified Streptomyces]MCX4988144.1 DUF6233 domain-containing protein [Streptomyces sp. NBC_00568]MCX5006652.1 DUF6233 domain-containing protein [Streptomyces sp. NBC_00638]